MRLTKTQMNWNNIDKKLKKGIGLADRELKIKEVSKFNNDIEKLMFNAANNTGQMEDPTIKKIKYPRLGEFHDFGEGDLFTQLQTGALFPDEIMGWNLKTIFAILLVLMILKVKKLQTGT